MNNDNNQIGDLKPGKIKYFENLKKFIPMVLDCDEEIDLEYLKDELLLNGTINIEEYIYEMVYTYDKLNLNEQKYLLKDTSINVNNLELLKDFNNSFSQCIEVMEDNNIVHIYYDINRFESEELYLYLKDKKELLSEDDYYELSEEFINPNGYYYLNFERYLEDCNNSDFEI